MKNTPTSVKNYLCVLALVGASLAVISSNANAQYAGFRITNQPLSFKMISPTGEASAYELVVSVTNNAGLINVLTNLSKRFDIAANSGNVSPATGVSVGKTNSTSLVSRLGTPIITNVTEYVEPVYPMNPSNPVTYSTNKFTNLEVPFAIFLNDGGRIKGTLKRSVMPGAGFDGAPVTYTNFYFEGGATQQGKIGFGGTDYEYGVPMPAGPMN